jgi:hypothetical protein
MKNQRELKKLKKQINNMQKLFRKTLIALHLAEYCGAEQFGKSLMKVAKIVDVQRIGTAKASLNSQVKKLARKAKAKYKGNRHD